MSESLVLSTGISGQVGPRAVSGEGLYLVLDDGRKVLDAMTTSAPVGHRHPRIVDAVCRAARTQPTLDEGWSTADRDETARELVEVAFAGEDWVGAVRYAVTGSEANDLALSLCQALTGRRPLVARERAYHGMVGLARDVTVQPQWHGGLSSPSGEVRPVEPAAPVRILPFPEGHLGSGLRLSREDVLTTLEGQEATLTDAAALIVDYSQGGYYSTPAYQDELAARARKAGALWIADEVVTGFGKTGFWFEFQRGEARPDIVTLGKPMGGGVAPVAAVVLSKRVLEAIGDSSWQNYSALRAHPTAVAATQAFVELVEEESLVERAALINDKMAAGFTGLADAHPSVRRADGRGLHWWIDLEGAEGWADWQATGDDPPLASQVSDRVLEAGVMVATSGEAASLLVSLPMLISDEQVAQVLEALDLGLDLADSVEQNQKGAS